ncbi:hypothetical protein GWI33_009249, partial [Rhynchophorus ferrugineus]
PYNEDARVYLHPVVLSDRPVGCQIYEGLFGVPVLPHSHGAAQRPPDD